MRHLWTVLSVPVLSALLVSCGNSTPTEPLRCQIEVLVPERVNAVPSIDPAFSFEAVVPVVIKETGGMRARLSSVGVTTPYVGTEWDGEASFDVEQLYTTDYVPAGGTLELPIRVRVGLLATARSWPAKIRFDAFDEFERPLKPTADFLLVAPE